MLATVLLLYADCLEMLEVSIFWNPKGLFSLYINSFKF